MREPLIFAEFPRLRERTPWRSLGTFPTPVERVEGLAPPAVELWVKREDRSGSLYGGNKVRKLEFLLAQALKRHCRRVATAGGYGSHHVLATAIYGAQVGLKVEAVLYPQPTTEHVRDMLQADLLANAELSPTKGYLQVPFAIRRAKRPKEGGLTDWIPIGGSSGVGSLGYVDAALEIVEQIKRGELPSPDLIYVALGSGGTVAGLVVGLGGRLNSEIRAVRVVERIACNGWKLRGTIAETERELRGEKGPRARFKIDHRFVGKGYGHTTAAADEAVASAARMGFKLEPTYTGKAMAALLADARSGALDGKRVLFINTYSSVNLRLRERLLAHPVSLPPLLRDLRYI